jgi:demethylmenaquinone methyltransferase/2-methoxy-6-polyprenyl-1,4-benzoquinol methylase
MPSSFYLPGKERSARVEDLFATIASRYDLINDLQSLGLHRRWKKRLIQLAKPEPHECALDLCCGTGDVAFRLAKAGTQTVGADFSLPMLQVGRNRFPNERIQFIRADALSLPFDDSTFDLLTISYGLRNLADVKEGLNEMQRVLKPGGRALVLDFGKPTNALFRTGYYAYLKNFVPLFGRIFCGNSATHAYIFESLLAYPAQKGVAELMRQSGWANIRIENLLGGMMSINFGEKR